MEATLITETYEKLFELINLFVRSAELAINLFKIRTEEPEFSSEPLSAGKNKIDIVEGQKLSFLDFDNDDGWPFDKFLITNIMRRHLTDLESMKLSNAAYTACGYLKLLGPFGWGVEKFEFKPDEDICTKLASFSIPSSEATQCKDSSLKPLTISEMFNQEHTNLHYLQQFNASTLPHHERDETKTTRSRYETPLDTLITKELMVGKYSTDQQELLELKNLRVFYQIRTLAVYLSSLLSTQIAYYHTFIERLFIVLLAMKNREELTGKLFQKLTEAKKIIATVLANLPVCNQERNSLMKKAPSTEGILSSVNCPSEEAILVKLMDFFPLLPVGILSPTNTFPTGKINGVIPAFQKIFSELTKDEEVNQCTGVLETAKNLVYEVNKLALFYLEEMVRILDNCLTPNIERLAKSEWKMPMSPITRGRTTQLQDGAIGAWARIRRSVSPSFRDSSPALVPESNNGIQSTGSSVTPSTGRKRSASTSNAFPPIPTPESKQVPDSTQNTKLIP